MKASLKTNAFVRFIITAGTLYLLLFFVHQFVIKKYTYYDQKFIGQIIVATEVVLKFIGYNTFTVLQDRDMQIVGIDGSHGVWVGGPCNAISLFILFAVFVIAYPGNQKAKWWFIPAGIVAIHILNILRVTALALMARHYPQYLNFNHTYTFTFLVYLFIFGLWLLWVNKFSNRKPI